jgi:uncharacterized protein YndB with AHSA1/START domain
MIKLHFSIQIAAPRAKVYQTMLADSTYRQWTAIFNPSGSYYEGSWDTGSTIRFLGPDADGNIGGMVAKIAENRPNEFVSIQHLGFTANGVDDFDSPAVKAWVPAYENYTFTDQDGGTLLSIELDSNEEYQSMFQGTWPKALETLKSLCEQ